MTPGTRLLEAAREWARWVYPYGQSAWVKDLVTAVAGMNDVRALYPSAHAIGDRVHVRYPPEKHPAYEDFTGVVVGVEFHTDGVDYRVRGDADPDYTVVDAMFVHGAT